MNNSTGDDIGEDTGKEIRSKNRAACQQARCGAVVSYANMQIEKRKESSRRVEESRQAQGKCKAGKAGQLLDTARR